MHTCVMNSAAETSTDTTTPVCQYCTLAVVWTRVPYGRFVHAATGDADCAPIVTVPTTPEVSAMPATFTPGTARWLSANGHPGYSANFARKVAAFIAAQFDADDIATASVQRYSGMVWAGVRAAR